MKFYPAQMDICFLLKPVLKWCTGLLAGGFLPKENNPPVELEWSILLSKGSRILSCMYRDFHKKTGKKKHQTLDTYIETRIKIDIYDIMPKK